MLADVLPSFHSPSFSQYGDISIVGYGAKSLRCLYRYLYSSRISHFIVLSRDSSISRMTSATITWIIVESWMAFLVQGFLISAMEFELTAVSKRTEKRGSSSLPKAMLRRRQPGEYQYNKTMIPNLWTPLWLNTARLDSSLFLAFSRNKSGFQLAVWLDMAKPRIMDAAAQPHYVYCKTKGGWDVTPQATFSWGLATELGTTTCATLDGE